jgi:hypothetical protein
MVNVREVGYHIKLLHVGEEEQGACNIFNLEYKISFLIYTKFRCYPLFFLHCFLLSKIVENYFVIYWRKPSEVSPRGALVVTFMPLQNVSKCKRCLKHVNIPYRGFR